VWLDFVSLFPKQTWKNRPNGLRADLAQMIYDLHPRFVRFPGGCVVEAGSIETAYDWKLTVGPVEQRAERWGPWNYRRTQGMGLFEYFQFCEDLGAEPLYVGFAGQTCIFREREHVPMEDMGWVRDNFLDVIEYRQWVRRIPKWAQLRAKAGRDHPFNLKLVEIGNENQGPEFQQRYEFIHSALKAKHPDLTYFADLSWTSRESMRDSKFDIEDQHYYNSPRWFATRFNEYDQRPRELPPLYLGEVAVTTGEAGPQRGNSARGVVRRRVPHGLRTQRRCRQHGFLRAVARTCRRSHGTHRRTAALARDDLLRRHARVRHGVVLPLETFWRESA
jgi:alpha-N-arabinofuranosidase